MAKITILGSGGWGMALAISAFGSGHNVVLWSPFENEVKMLKESRVNERLLSGVKLPDGIDVTSDISAVSGSAVTVIATPSTAIREVASRLSVCRDFGIVVNVAKGLEKGSLLRLSQVIKEEIPGAKIAVLSGPSHAEEVARGELTTVVAASDSPVTSQIAQDIMSSDNLRVYTSDDMIGVELGGALKNVIAIASGFCDGLGLGDNSRAALITRGLAEMARLGVCMGAKEYTFFGLAGIGDLVVTCTSRHSRNHRFGCKVGSGTPIAQALEEVGTVEGYYAADMAYRLARKYNIEMPIIEECHAVLYENKDVRGVPNDLMRRPQRSEH